MAVGWPGAGRSCGRRVCRCSLVRVRRAGAAGEGRFQRTTLGQYRLQLIGYRETRRAGAPKHRQRISSVRPGGWSRTHTRVQSKVRSLARAAHRPAAARTPRRMPGSKPLPGGTCPRRRAARCTARGHSRTHGHIRPDARFQQRTSIFLTASFHLRPLSF